jgi:hypothetical protein
MKIFDTLTGCNISELYAKLPEDMLLEIGRTLEGDAREYERQYRLMQPIIEDSTPLGTRMFYAPRFVLNRDTGVSLDLRYWDPAVRRMYQRIDGAKIPVDRNEFDHYTYEYHTLDTNYPTSQSALPGKVHVLKKMGFQLDSAQGDEGYLTSQEITIDSCVNHVPQYTIDAIMDDGFKHIDIYIRTHTSINMASKYIQQYELEPLCISTSFSQSLCHFITHEIKKINIECVVKAKKLYEKCCVPHHIITTLYTFASRNLSWRENEELHSLLAQSKKFGDIQALPNGCMPEIFSRPCEARKLLCTWGFRTPEEIEKINREKMTKINTECVLHVERLYANRGAHPDIIKTLYTLAHNLSSNENRRLHSLLALSKEFGIIQAIPEGYIPEVYSWSNDVRKLLYTWGFRTEEEMPNIPICVVS